MEFTKREVLAKCSGENGIDNALKFLKCKLNVNKSDDEYIRELRKCVRQLVTKKNIYFNASHRMYSRFNEKYKNWLDSKFLIPNLVKNRNNRGRPKKEYNKMSERTKRRNITNVSTELKNNPIRILKTARFAAKKNKMDDLSNILKQILLNKDNLNDIKKKTKYHRTRSEKNC